MQGGAWQSDVSDNGRDFQKTRASPTHAAAGMEAGTPPPMYNPSPVPMGKDSRSFGIMVVSLRSALIIFTLIAFSVMAANKESIYNSYSGVYSTSYYKSTVKFSAVKAFVLGRLIADDGPGVGIVMVQGLLSLDIIVCVYAIVQLVLCFVQVSSTGAFISSPTGGGSMITFIFDTVLAYTLIAAAGAAADSQSILAEDNFCDSLPGFCRKAEASIAMSFLAFALLATCAALYPVRLLKLQSK